MQTYSIEVDVSFLNEHITTWVNVQAQSKEEATQKALKMVNDSLDIRAGKPLEVDNSDQAAK